MSELTMRKMLQRCVAGLTLGLCLVAGNVSGHELVFTTNLNGANENPTNGSLGTGTSIVTVDQDLVTMRVQANFTGLTGNVTAAHIHCCTLPPGNVGVATPTPTFPDFPSGVTSGSYDKTFDMSLSTSYNAGYITNNGGSVSTAFQALVQGLSEGKAYLNIHTTSVGSGEIRGFFVPEPSATALGWVGIAVSGWVRRRRHR